MQFRISQAWQYDTWAQYTEEMLIEWVERFAEYHWSESDSRYSAVGWRKLKQDIETNGIREPLLIELNPFEGYALLTEGNHRLGIAREIGLETVPVRVMRSPRLSDINTIAPKLDMIEIRVKPDRYGYVPGHMKPSEAFNLR